MLLILVSKGLSVSVVILIVICVSRIITGNRLYV